MFESRWCSKETDVGLSGDTVRSMELWLRAFHSTTDALPVQSISVEEVWHTIMAGDKYGFDFQRLKSWFVAWYKWMRTENGEEKFFEEFGPQLLFPCYAFNYAVGFQDLTRFITYNESRHIIEINPTHHRQMHLRSLIIRKSLAVFAMWFVRRNHLNAAKDRLRTRLHQALFTRVNEIIDEATCACKEKTVFDFLKELRRIRVSPLDSSSTKASIAEMLDRLQQFNAVNTRAHTSVSQSRQRLCLHCRLNGKVIVEEAIERVSKYFDGLCLDCMERTKDLKVDRNKDQDYWFHHLWKESYDRKCRLSHGEPTWYFSFMGRKEKRGLIAE
ncbi:hypothetical protein CNMCM6106_008289 [Aspergillus hiratsukae]|uniref:Uncharacterized protein n=1 Tax=Aspergillus hiratsukae TaxID=1194566 RepID=A0A8H6QLQ5_9EURO|nr:hypothetical protein CNMCM6106_008289 [Aspergillus hiratsukae]